MKNSLSKVLPFYLFTLFCLLFALHGQAAETVTYLHTDVSGSPIAATDAQGNVVWRESYRPYGEKLKNQSASASNRQFFHNKPYDQESGLSYFGARYYDPIAGRFYATDPVDFQEDNLHSFNRYAYGNNNPYRYLDPDGRLPALALLIFVGKEIAGEAFEQTTGLPAPTVKGITKGVIKHTLKEGAEHAVESQAKHIAKGTVQANKAAGDAFEEQVKGQLQQVQSGVVQQITVKTQSGVRTRIDLMGRDVNGNIVCTECKASATARLTKNQAAAFPEIQQSGAVIVGKGKPGLPGGTNIPPTTVNVTRP